MAELRTGTDLEEVSINGKVTVWLNFTDAEFVSRVAEAFDEMGAIHDKCAETINNKDIDAKDMFAALREANNSIREKINTLFGDDICTPVYGSMSVMALADGLPVLCNLMLALVDEINARMTEQQKKTAPRLDKYTAKYLKK